MLTTVNSMHVAWLWPVVMLTGCVVSMCSLIIHRVVAQCTQYPLSNNCVCVMD